MRCFVAIDPSEEVRERLAAVLADLRQLPVKASWTQPENMHLTLRFLGDIDSSAAAMIGDELAASSQGLGAFDLSVSGLGAFPNVRKPQIIWAGLGPLEGGLQTCVRLAESAAVSAGLVAETRPYKPHLTLGRVRERHPAAALTTRMQDAASFDGGAFTVRSMTLYESKLTKTGPIYIRLREFAL